MRFSIGNGSFTEAVTDVAPIYTTFDSTANDSNKSWVVPNGEMWRLNWAYVLLVTTATVGNRVVTLLVKDESGNNVYLLSSGLAHAASTTRHYTFNPGGFRGAAVASLDSLQVSIPDGLYLPAGFTLQLYDSAAIDAAADDMTVSFQVKVYKGA